MTKSTTNKKIKIKKNKKKIKKKKKTVKGKEMMYMPVSHSSQQLASTLTMEYPVAFDDV